VILALLVLAACDNGLDVIPLHFDGPVAAAVLPADAGPFDLPTGFVANSRSGTIVPLDLKMGRLLTDDPTASFLRTAALPTGRARILADVAVVAAADGEVTLWAIDSAFSRLLQVPYVLSVDADGFPVEVEPVATDPVFDDADSSGDAPTISDLVVRAGFTTTEEWSIEYDGTRWWAKGSRSGTQQRAPVAGVTYESDNGEVQFVLDGTATTGDRFTFATDTGIVEYDVGGLPTGVYAQDGRVYVTAASNPGEVLVYDGITGDLLGNVPFPDGAQPTRMSGAPDGRLFVADGTLPQVWELRFDETDDPATVPVETIAAAGPVIDVAWQGGEDRAGVPFDHLFIAAAGTLRVDAWDLETSTWVDPNPLTPDTDGLFLGAPITGLGASFGPVSMPHETDWGARPTAPTVAVATADGFVYQLEASTGCAVMDTTGPFAEPSDSDASTIALVDQGETSSLLLEADDDGDQVVPSACGGVARTETWTVTYDSATLSWEVEGSLSGIQANRAVEDLRYLSDDGGVSFLIAPGALPATDGDHFTFHMDSGLLVFRGSDPDEDGVANPPWEYPARPVGFETLNGPTGGGWDEVDRKQYMLLPVTNTDIAARLHLDSGKTEVLWE
jgi:hypothetical protein